MKSLKYIAILLCSVLFVTVSCNENDEDLFSDPNAFSDVSWYASLRHSDVFELKVNNVLSILDLSNGTTSHTWTIEDGSFFIDGDFSTNEASYEPYIIDGAGLTSESDIIHVLFTKPGLQSIRLYNTFNEKVTFKGATKTLEAQQAENGLWVIDTTFTVDVYDKIAPAFKVYHNDVEILSIPADQTVRLADSASWETITVQAGIDELKFVDETTVGRPTTREWVFDYFEGEFTQSEQSIIMEEEGTFLAGTLQAKRTGDNPLLNETASKRIPLKFNVEIPPLIYKIGGISEDESEVISFATSDDVDAASLATAASDFTVHVSNSHTGFDADVTVQEVRVQSGSANVIELVLSEPIYSSDMVTVAYSGTSVRATNNYVLYEFSAEEVTMFRLSENQLPSQFSDFETHASNNMQADGWWGQRNWDATNGYRYWERTEEYATSGSAGLRFLHEDVTTMTNSITAFSVGGNVMYNEAGDYEISFDIFVPATTDLTSGLSIGYQYNPAGESFLLPVDVSSLEKGKWIKVSKMVTFESAYISSDSRGRQIFFRMENPQATNTRVELFIDNLQVKPTELRPQL